MSCPESTTDPELFARLAELALPEREAALAALPAGQRQVLEALLAADADPDDPLGTALGAAAAASEGAPGLRLGAWKVLRELGSGGMGTVLLAQRDDGQYRQRAAIKLIRGFPTQDGIRRLRRERQILAALDHPFIARLIDGGETTDGQPFVVMEFVDGEALLACIEARALPLEERLALFDRIAEAVEYAHRSLVVHRDLKPSNVLVRADGTPKLLDFGVAKLLEPDPEETDPPAQTATVAYSAGFASPEQRAGLAVTTLTDVYALGLLLQTMLSGHPGREEGSSFPALTADMELRGLIAMATAGEPADRYASVEALREDLRRYRQHVPMRAAPDTSFYRMRKFLRRHRWQSAAAMVLLAAALAFTWRLGVERDRAVEARAVALERGAAARRAANSARRTLDYVVRIFGYAHPDRVLGRPLTPRQLIDEASAELGSAMSAEPEARRTLQSVLGKIYGALGAPREAQSLLAAAVADFEPESREDGLWLADALAALSAARRATDDPEAAARAIGQAAALRLHWAPEEPRQKIQALGEEAQAALYAGDEKLARQRWDSAIELARQRHDTPPELVEDLLLSLSGMAEQAGALELGDAVTAELMQRLETRLPQEHPALITAMRQRAGVLGYLGRIDESEAMFRRAIALHEHMIGGTGERLAHIENDFGVMLTGAGRFRDAVPHYLRSVELVAQALGGMDHVDGVTLLNLGSAQEGMGDYAAGLASVDLAIERLRARRAPDDDELLRALGNRARNLALLGRFDEARAQMNDAIVRLRAAQGPDSVWATFNEFRLAQIEFWAGGAVESRRQLEAVAPAFVRLFPPAHPAIAQLHRLRGRLALVSGDMALAAGEFGKARRILVDSHAMPIDFAMLEASEAALSEARGELTGARELLERALPVLRAELLPGEVNRAEAEALAAQPGMATGLQGGQGPDSGGKLQLEPGAREAQVTIDRGDG